MTSDEEKAIMVIMLFVVIVIVAVSGWAGWVYATPDPPTVQCVEYQTSVPC